MTVDRQGPDDPPSAKTWAVKRIALSLDEHGYAYIQRQRQRLRSLSDSELVRNLLREHELFAAELERLRAKVERLQRKSRRPPRHR